MSRKKMRSKADEFEMDEAGYDEYTNSPAEQHIYEDAVSAEPEYRAPKAKKKKRKKGGADEFVAYVDISEFWSSGYDPNKIISALADASDYDKAELLYQNGLSATYLISK